MTYEQAIDRYREALIVLEAMTAKRFPNGSMVAITLTTTAVRGVVHAQVALCPDRIAVLLENGNVWDYPVEKVSPCIAKTTLPKTRCVK